MSDLISREVIGSAGSPEKVEFLVKDCGFDVAFDYKMVVKLE
jgi:NADPH-dependent curcumin reductase CurA